MRGIHRWPVNSPYKGKSSDVFFDLCLNKRLSKQSWGWWFETPLRSLWRHCNVYGCSPVGPNRTNLKTFRNVRWDLSAKTLYLIIQNYWENVVLKGWNSSWWLCVIWQCLWMYEKYESTILEWNVYPEEMYIWPKRQFPSERSTTYKLLFQIFQKLCCQKYGTYSQHHIKWGHHLIHSKTWSKLGLDQPANVVSAVCLQLNFPIISTINNLTNHNCLLMLNWRCGLILSTAHDYDFCFL